jgi:hypothetical protein
VDITGHDVLKARAGFRALRRKGTWCGGGGGGLKRRGCPVRGTSWACSGAFTATPLRVVAPPNEREPQYGNTSRRSSHPLDRLILVAEAAEGPQVRHGSVTRIANAAAWSSVSRSSSACFIQACGIRTRASSWRIACNRPMFFCRLNRTALDHNFATLRRSKISSWYRQRYPSGTQRWRLTTNY